MSDLISREALLKVIRDDRLTNASDAIYFITNAPAIEQGDFGISVMKYTEFGIVPDDYKNQASGYRAGWNDCIASVKYVFTTPQQPQSVADALEEAAKGIDSMVKTYIESGNKHPEVSEGRERCVNKARAAMSCAETVRALIKRNAKVVE